MSPGGLQFGLQNPTGAFCQPAWVAALAGKSLHGLPCGRKRCGPLGDGKRGIMSALHE
jgi:hypothetical protein